MNDSQVRDLGQEIERDPNVDLSRYSRDDLEAFCRNQLRFILGQRALIEALEREHSSVNFCLIVSLIRFAVQNSEKFIENDPDGTKRAWIQEGKLALGSSTME